MTTIVICGIMISAIITGIAFELGYKVYDKRADAKIQEINQPLDKKIEKYTDYYDVKNLYQNCILKVQRQERGISILMCFCVSVVAFAIGGYFGIDSLQSTVKHLEDENAQYEEALEDYYYEATSIIENVHSEARSNLYSAEGEAWGADYTAEALRCGEVTYREVAEQYMKLSESVSDAVYYAEQKPPELEYYLDVISRIKWG